jgi:hypothetical protein
MSGLSSKGKDTGPDNNKETKERKVSKDVGEYVDYEDME